MFKLFITGVLLFCSCFLAHAQPAVNQKETHLYLNAGQFADTVNAIEKQIGDLTHAGAVFNCKAFIAIYENPQRYVNNVLHYLEYDAKTQQQKLIAIGMMNKKDLNNNIYFLSKCSGLYSKKLITEDDLSWIIYPRLNNNIEIIKNYKLKRVRAVLAEIKNQPFTSADFKQNLAEVLSGKAFIRLRRVLIK